MPMRPAHLAASLSLAALLGACDKPKESVPAAAQSTSAQTTTAQSTSSQVSTAPAVKGPVVDWAVAGEGDLPEIVARNVEQASKDGRTVIVYVGATWCEPCQRFHNAATAGELEGSGLPPIRILEFDLDRDGERLGAAGYGSKMIPLFAVPGKDGRDSGARIEGSIKGSGAVSNIVPRLRALLSRAKGS